MKALVTGGAGFIGSTLVDRLLGDGWTVAAVDNLSSGKPANLEQARTSGEFSFYELDIRDEGLAAVVAEVSPDVVFHLAAQIDVRISVSDPALDAGIKWLTVYAFSTENWKRPADEVRYLMNFNERLLLTRRDEFNARNVRMRFIGRRDWRVPKRLARHMDDTAELTKRNRGRAATRR